MALYNCSGTPSTTSSMTEVISWIVVEVFIGLFTCCGNILTIVAVWKTSVLRTVPNMYVVSLAVADLFVGAVVVPVQIAILTPSLGHLINTSKLFCLLIRSSVVIPLSVSVFNMALIAVDRALYIGYPFYYERVITFKKAACLIIAVWICCVLIGTFPIYSNTWKPCVQCESSEVLTYEYRTYVQMPIFALCCIVIMIGYWFIFRVARKQHKNMTAQEGVGRSSDMKLIKAFASVFGFFILCYVPSLAVTWAANRGIAIPRIVFNACTPIILINSGLNVIVYAVQNIDFKQAFIKIMSLK